MFFLEFFYLVYWTLLFLYLGYNDKKPNVDSNYRLVVKILSIVILVLYVPAILILVTLLPVLLLVLPLLVLFLFILFLPLIIALMVLFGDVEHNKEVKKTVIAFVWVHIALTMLVFLGFLSFVGFKYKNISILQMPTKKQALLKKK